MTSQEQDMLNDLVQKINGTRLQEKDDDAERLLRDGLGRNPDALYMLAQTVLVQNIALDQARQQMMAMQQAPPPQPAKATSFLGSLLGHRDPEPPPPQQQYQQQYQPVQYAQQAPGNYQGGNYQAPPSGQPSFLRSAATTAAGVAAGALAFQGVESLLHGGMGGGGFGGMGGGYGGDFGGGFGGAPREEIVNNYYDSPGGNQNVAGPDEQPQGPYDSGAQDASYGDDFSDGGGDFGGDDDTNYS